MFRPGAMLNPVKDLDDKRDTGKQPLLSGSEVVINGVAMVVLRSPINCLSLWCINTTTWTMPIALTPCARGNLSTINGESVQYNFSQTNKIITARCCDPSDFCRAKSIQMMEPARNDLSQAVGHMKGPDDPTIPARPKVPLNKLLCSAQDSWQFKQGGRLNERYQQSHDWSKAKITPK